MRDSKQDVRGDAKRKKNLPREEPENSDSVALGPCTFSPFTHKYLPLNSHQYNPPQGTFFGGIIESPM